MIEYIFLIIGFGFLIKGADFLVDGASALAKKLNISDLVIGLTVVAFGTSMPELMVNIIAGVKGTTDIAIGNILGSNTFNILVILGISSIIYPLIVRTETIWKEIPLSLLAALLVLVLSNDRFFNNAGENVITRSEGVVLLAFFIIFLVYIYESTKKGRSKEFAEEFKGKHYSLLYAFVLIAIGFVGLFFGGKWVVESAVVIAHTFGISESIIGLTIVAAGTSLPELATSAVAAKKKNADIAVGNIVGSNIFNILFILGISALIRPLPFAPNSNFDTAMVIVATVLLFKFMFIGKKSTIERWQGILFLLIYVGYIAFILLRG